MVYAPQRRHAVASLSTTLHALAVLQHLYAPNFWVLLGRLLAQLHFRAPPILSPTHSLLGLFFMITAANGLAVLFHIGSGPPDGSRGVPLDFIGQKHIASLARVLVLDAVIYFLQLTTLIVCYVVNYGPTLPESSVFPYDDLLLPPDAPAQTIPLPDIDVEGGDQFLQRRLGKGPRYQRVASTDSDMWLDEEEGQEDAESLRSSSNPRLVATSYGSRRQSSRVPLIFNISFTHLFNLVFRLPSPTPEGLTSGGTPLQSPPSSPRPTDTELSLLAAAVAQATANREEFHFGSGVTPSVTRGRPSEFSSPNRTSTERATEQDHDDNGGRSERISDDHSLREDEGDNSGRIPGDYWATRANP